jgi:hypothetical protein
MTNDFVKQIPLDPNHRKSRQKAGDSHFWSRLMKVKQNFLRFGSFKLNNGSQISFWEDKRIGNHAFKDQYPSLYNIHYRKSRTFHRLNIFHRFLENRRKIRNFHRPDPADGSYLNFYQPVMGLMKVKITSIGLL